MSVEREPLSVELRMRGLPPGLVASALIAAWPLAFCGYVILARHQPIASTMILGAAALAPLPWLSRLAARLSYRAIVDELALHVAGEALLWSTITGVEERRSWRRTTLVLRRGKTICVELVIRDLFAGRLQPIEALRRHLPRNEPAA